MVSEAGDSRPPVKPVESVKQPDAQPEVSEQTKPVKPVVEEQWSDSSVEVSADQELVDEWLKL